VESVIEQEQDKLVLSETIMDLAYPITACKKHLLKQPVIMPTQQQEQRIYIITNDENNRNCKTTFKTNWQFITAIFVLTITYKLYEMLENTFFDHIEMMKHLHIEDTRRYQRTKSAYEEVKAKNRELETKITITNNKLMRSEQELKLEKEKNNNHQLNLKITKEKLKATQDSNTGFTIELTTTKKELKATQDCNINLKKKITITEKELKNYKQKLNEERKQVIEKLKQAYKELQETCNKIKQEKIEEETKKHQEILEKAEKSLNNNEC
ncbi:8526_t:CDS:2, partial [Cetraspora pellucida]